MKTSKRKKILIVDDEQHIVKLITVALGGCGFTTGSAFSAAEALQMLRSKAYDGAVINDGIVGIFGEYSSTSGWSIVNQLRNSSLSAKNRAIPVIMLLDDEKSPNKVLDHVRKYANLLIAKPFNPIEVTKKVLELTA